MNQIITTTPIRFARRACRRLRHYYVTFGVLGVSLFLRELLGERSTLKATVGIGHHGGAGRKVGFRLGTSDIDVLYSVWGRRDYDCVLNRAVKTRDDVTTILDAGAYVGYSALYFADRFPKATIFAVEPEPGNFALLMHNVADCPRIVPIQAAIWKRSGVTAVCDRGTGPWGYAVSELVKGKPLVAKDVPSVTIDEIIQRYCLDRINLIKLDVEGAEKDILANCVRWINQVDILVAELYDRFTPGCSKAWKSATHGFHQAVCRGGLVLAWRGLESQ